MMNAGLWLLFAGAILIVAGFAVGQPLPKIGWKPIGWRLFQTGVASLATAIIIMYLSRP